MYDLVIIGGGPAGVGASVYASRKKLKTLLIADSFGGQSAVSEDIHNWIGTVSISGFDLAKNLEEHVRRYERDGDIEVWQDAVSRIVPIENGFSLETRDGKKASTTTVLVASGSRRRRLGVPGEDVFDGKGLAWCATCDAPLFKGRSVAIIGGGNAGLEAALSLDPYATKLYLLQRSGRLKGDAITQEKVKGLEKMTVIFNVQTVEIVGDIMVTGLLYIDGVTGEKKKLDVGGIFVEIGSVPNRDFLGDLVEYNQYGEIVVNHKTQASSLPGIWAAGDVSDVLYKQNNVSVGDAVKAVLNIFDYVKMK